MIKLNEPLEVITGKLKKVFKHPTACDMKYKFNDYAACELDNNFLDIAKCLGIRDVRDLIFATKNYALYKQEFSKIHELSKYENRDIEKSYKVFKHMANMVQIKPDSLVGGVALNVNWECIYGEPAFLGMRSGHSAMGDFLDLIMHFPPCGSEVTLNTPVDYISNYYVSPSIYEVYRLLGVDTIGGLLEVSKDKTTFFRKARVNEEIRKHYNIKQLGYIWEITKVLRKLLTTK